MCPLRLILIFLSATLAGFFLIRNLKSQPSQIHVDHVDDAAQIHPNPNKSKMKSAIGSGFWMFVDMASGRYLWRHLVSSSSKRSG